MITDEVAEVFQYSTRIIIMKHGEFISEFCSGSVDEKTIRKLLI